MVRADHHTRGSRATDKLVCTVLTDVVEHTDFVVMAADRKQTFACNLERGISTTPAKSDAWHPNSHVRASKPAFSSLTICGSV